VPPTLGAEVVVAMPVGPLRILAPCRVVSVVDERAAYGFTYGTLPGHPESGEESFTVTLDGDGMARFTIAVASRPADVLARLGAPVTHAVQRRALRGYLDGLRRFVEGNP
jgi:uncharacterized protein (UPF0548 family)